MSETSTPRHTARPLRLLGRFLRRSWQGLTVAVLAIALGIAAYLSPGLVEADVRLDEGNIYAVNRDRELLGTINSQIKQLSSAISIPDAQTRVLQSGETVLLFLPKSSSLVPLNAARNVTGSTTQLPLNSQVQLVGDQLLVYRQVSGSVWAGGVDELLNLDFEKEKPDFEMGEGGVATLTTDGQVIGLDPTRSVLVRTAEGAEITTALPFEIAPDSQIELSAVGDRAVVLDRTSSRIWVEGMDKAFSVSEASSARLMAPAPDALGGEDGTRAVYANSAGLNRVTADGLESLSGRIDKAALAPVQVGDCVYGAGVSGDDGTFVKVCRGQEPVLTPIESIGTDGTSIVFQVNRGVVILNDQADGTVWMVDKDMFIIHPSDWTDVLPEQREDDDAAENTDSNQLPDRSEENRAPIAKDDFLGARAGTATILTVLDNDTDPDGDVVTISTSTELDGASLQTISNGSGLQITIDGDPRRTEYVVDYTIDDGRGGRATAQATVEVLPADRTVNRRPVPSVKPGGHKPMKVRLGSQVSRRVLLDWRDPDGDPLMLKDASLAGDSEDMLTFTPDGTVNFIDVGKTTGEKTVMLIVSDGVTDATGELVFEVTEDAVPPVAHGDFVTAVAGAPVRVEPLANDQISKPRLSDVVAPQECTDCVLVPNYREMSFVFTAPREGTYYVTYTILDGGSATGVVRIDVRSKTTNLPPVAAQDVALLPTDGTVTLDPLLNDTDPDGDVLVVQTYNAPDSLEVVMERRHVMTIRAVRDLTVPEQFTYVVSDGQSVDTGTIIVVPTSGGSYEPNVDDDYLRVRAGTTGTVTPLANDTSPVGLSLSLAELGENPFGERAWIDGDRVRVSVPAGTPAGVQAVPYRVADSRGNSAAGFIDVEIISEEVTNADPVPEPVVDRVLAGTETRIAIPLGGIDPNGDAVRLVGIASGPKLGRITSVGEEYLTYEAFETSQGTDTFSYQVADSHGQTGEAEVRVGVAKKPVSNVMPVAVTDRISVRPGRPVRISALDNDFDADGDAIGYLESAPVESDPAIEAGVQDREIVFTAPGEPGMYSGTYTIEDARQGRSDGQFIVEVDEEAPLLPPVVRDDSVPVAALTGQRYVEVGVLENDYDPDGAKDQLRIEIDESLTQVEDRDQVVRVNDTGDRLIVPVQKKMQQIRYTVVDGDDNRANGLVTVPGTDDAVPVLKNPGIELTATAGQPLLIDVNTHVAGTRGRTVRLTDQDHVWPTGGIGKAAGATIEYTADIDYRGPASIAFQVRDEVPAESKDPGPVSVITIALNVLPATQSRGPGEGGELEEVRQGPVLIVENPRLLVGAGEGERSLNLLSLFNDPDGGPGSMTLVGGLTKVSGDADVRTRLSGDTLYAEAPDNARVDSTQVLAGAVIDADSIRRDFEVTVVVTRSTRPLVSTGDDVVDRATAGSTVQVPVLANDRSNLLIDKTLTLVSAAETGPGGTVSADPSSGTVTVRLQPGWSGNFTARYTVNDATGDPSRQTTGQIRITVVDRPGQPSTPFNGRVSDGTIVLQYRQINGDGGIPIMSAEAVASSQGLPDVTGRCSALTCTVTGLKNGAPWTVRVRETNDVGPSEFSPASAALTPDTEPNPPGQPSVTFGDGELKINWTHNPVYSSPNGGSPLTGYVVRMTGGGATVLSERLSPETHEHVWKGLTNGTPYTFEVEATNASGRQSGFSVASVAEYPSTVPSGNTAPTQSPVEDEIGGGFTVSFNASAVANGGAAITGYTVVPMVQGGGYREGDAETLSPAAGTLTTTVRGMGLSPTRFEIRATNRSGTAVVGQTAEYQIAYPLAKITAVTATPADSAIAVAVTSNVDGAPATFEYSVDGGAWRDLGGSSGTVTGLTNGRRYDLRFRVRLGSQESNVYSVDSVMPKSTQPPGPQPLTPLLKLPDSVLYDFDDSLEGTGGWGIGAYSFCVTTGYGCYGAGSFSTSRPLVLEAGRTNFIYWRVNGQSRRYERVIAGVTQPTMEGARVSFSLPYVTSGSCTVVARNAEGGTQTSEVHPSNGSLSAALHFDAVPVPDAPADAPATSPAVSATVTCNANQLGSQTWNLS